MPFGRVTATKRRRTLQIGRRSRHPRLNSCSSSAGMSLGSSQGNPRPGRSDTPGAHLMPRFALSGRTGRTRQGNCRNHPSVMNSPLGRVRIADRLPTGPPSIAMFSPVLPMSSACAPRSPLVYARFLLICICGSLEIDSAPGQGTRIRLRVPLTPSMASIRTFISGWKRAPSTRRLAAGKELGVEAGRFRPSARSFRADGVRLPASRERAEPR